MPHPRRPLFLAFAGMGATASLVPAALPSLAERLGVPTDDLLGAVPALFAGLLVAVLLAPLVARWRSAAFGVRAGAALQGLGLLALVLAPLPGLVVAAAALAGLGFGLVEASGTVLARQVTTERVTRTLVLLTATVAVVAAVGPLLLVVAGPLVLLAAVLLHLVTVVVLRVPAAETAPAPREALRASLRGLVPLAVALFCYVGVESVLAGWSAATVQSQLGTTASLAAVGTSAFWVLMSIGRFVGGRVLARWRTAVVVLGCLGGICVLLAGAAAAASAPLGIALLALAVVLCGPCYALFLGTALDGVPERLGSSVVASLIACGAAGGTVIPLLATLAGGATLWVAAVFALLAVVVLVAARVWRPQERTETA